VELRTLRPVGTWLSNRETNVPIDVREPLEADVQASAPPPPHRVF
jgi:hypothetical protein